eukprot:6087939-Pyramimonas_sp.AAC.1
MTSGSFTSPPGRRTLGGCSRRSGCSSGQRATTAHHVPRRGWHYKVSATPTHSVARHRRRNLQPRDWQDRWRYYWRLTTAGDNGQQTQLLHFFKDDPKS